ncbi:MAG: DUF4238 domain-containing protein [Solirubrobacteraceae bacterium]
MAAGHEPPFVQEFRDIAEGTKPMPTTDARRQHYVPSFLLARWATPKNRKGSLVSLAVAGKTAARKPGNVALEKDLYTIDKHAASVNLVFEAFLAIVECHAADPIKRLATAPQPITDDDRATIAYLLALQQPHATGARAAPPGRRSGRRAGAARVLPGPDRGCRPVPHDE